MRMDDTKVVPNTARSFRAFGGGFGVKMDIAQKSGEAKVVDGVTQVFLFGSFERSVADRLVHLINRSDGTKRHSAFLLIGMAKVDVNAAKLKSEAAAKASMSGTKFNRKGRERCLVQADCEGLWS